MDTVRLHTLGKRDATRIPVHLRQHVLGRWLDHITRHQVGVTTWAIYSKQLRLAEDRLGEIPACQLRSEQVTTFVSELADGGSSARHDWVEACGRCAAAERITERR